LTYLAQGENQFLNCLKRKGEKKRRRKRKKKEKFFTVDKSEMQASSLAIRCLRNESTFFR